MLRIKRRRGLDFGVHLRLVHKQNKEDEAGDKERIFPDVLDQVEKAVVKPLKKGRQGILVDECKIITAAHCITWECGVS